VVTYTVIALCIAVFVPTSVMPVIDPGLLSRLPVWRHGFEWWQLATSAFLHGGWLHLGFNMLVLAALGPNVEDKLGHLRYIALYTLGAAASGMAHVLSSPNPAIGASGAIAAVTGAYLVLFPATRIICFAFWITVVGKIQVPAWWFIGLNIAIDLLANGFGGGTGIAHAAHLGGYALGIAVVFLLLQLRLLAREPNDLFTILRQKRRRAAIQAAVRDHHDRVARTVGADARAAPVSPGLARDRAEVARLVAIGEMGEAVAAYERFSAAHEHTVRGASLAPDHQLRLAEHLLAADRPRLALHAFRSFAATYPTDRQTPGVQLMVGLLLARRLAQPDEARSVLTAVEPRLDGDDRSLARQILAELGRASPAKD
jgi:membrane associated rhomboid family serine protease